MVILKYRNYVIFLKNCVTHLFTFPALQLFAKKTIRLLWRKETIIRISCLGVWYLTLYKAAWRQKTL
jgi:hypothetical protein